MSAIQQLITEHMDIWTAADTGKRSGRGRASSNAGSVYGVKKLRELILELAVRGKLVPQDANDEPASELVKRIQTEKVKLVAEGKIKKEKPLAPISEDDKPFELPLSWDWVHLPDISDYKVGKTPSTKISAYWTNSVGGYNWVSIADLNHDNYVFETNKQITSKAVSEVFRCEPAPAGTILMSFKLTLGKISLLDAPAFHNEAIISIYPNQAVFKEYLFKVLPARALDGDSKSAIKGNTLNSESIAALLIPLPPLAEQHRIITKVDELMALCDQLEAQHCNAVEAHEKLVNHLLGTLTQSQRADDLSANWQRIYAHFDVLFTTEASIDALKQTLLQLAVMGKLVPQDPKDEPASELLKRIQAEKAKLIAEGKLKKEKPLAPIADDEKPFGLPNGWEWVRLSDASTYIQYGYTDSANQTNREILFLRITDIQDDFVDWTSVPGCNSDLKQVQDYLLSENDIVIARTGGTIGKSYLVKDLTVNSIFASYLIRIGKIENINHKFKKLYFGSQLYWNQLYANSMGTGQPNVNGTALKGLVFSLPPIAEQQRIVAKVNALMALCDQLKTRIQLANLQQQAIANALVAQAVA